MTDKVPRSSVVAEGNDSPVATVTPLVVRRRQNANIPVHQLPNELLIEILLLTRESRRQLDTRVASGWSSVCRRWHDVITLTPMFWRQIPLGCEPRLLDLILIRNPSGPLEIAWLSEDDSLATTTMTRMFAAPVEVLQRCHSIYVKTPCHGAMNHIISRYGPHATHIDLSFAVDPSTPRGYPVTLSNGTPVESLLVRGGGFFWSAWKLPRLSSLRLLFLQDLSAVPSTLLLFGMLARASEIEVIALDSFPKPFEISEDQDYPLIMTLPCLKLLYVHGVPPSWSQRFLTHVRTPSLEFLTIGHDCGNEHPDDRMELLSSISLSNWKGHDLAVDLSWALLTIRDRGTVPVDIWPLEYSTSRGPPTHLWLDILLVRADRPYLEQTFSLISGWTSQVFTLTIDTLGPNFARVPAAERAEVTFGSDPARWHRLVYLRLEGDADSMVPFLRFLARPLGDIPQHVLPNLFHLFIDLNYSRERCTRIAEEVVSLAQTRYATVSPTRTVNGFNVARLYVTASDMLLKELNSKEVPPSMITKQPPEIPYPDLIQP